MTEKDGGQPLALDLRGLSCPLPIVKTAKAMRELRPGRLIEVFTNDPGSAPDIIAWSKTTGNPIVEARALDGVYRFVLKKKSRITAAGTAARRPRRPPVVHSEVTTP